MAEQIIHIPLMFRKPPDPREQSVSDEPSPAPESAESILAKARAGLLNEPCTPCGRPLRHHWSIAGAWVGCDGAKRGYNWPTNPERWNDPYPHVTVAMANAMLDGSCGPVLEHVTAKYTRDELLTLASTLFRIGLSEYLRERAERGK